MASGASPVTQLRRVCVYLDVCALNRPLDDQNQMITQTYLPEETMIQRGIEALMRALGPVETARFLTLPRHRYADYVGWRHQWQETLDPKQFFDQVFGATTRVAE